MRRSFQRNTQQAAYDTLLLSSMVLIKFEGLPRCDVVFALQAVIWDLSVGGSGGESPLFSLDTNQSNCER